MKKENKRITKRGNNYNSNILPCETAEAVAKKLADLVEEENKNPKFNPYGLTKERMEAIKYEPLDKYSDRKAWLGSYRYCRVTFNSFPILYDTKGNVILTRHEELALRENPDCFNKPRENKTSKPSTEKIKQAESEVIVCEQWDVMPVEKRWRAMREPLPADGRRIHIFYEIDTHVTLFAFTIYNGLTYSDPVLYPKDQAMVYSGVLIQKGADVFWKTHDEQDRHNRGSVK